jgi:hypothetical protein
MSALRAPGDDAHPHSVSPLEGEKTLRWALEGAGMDALPPVPDWCYVAAAGHFDLLKAKQIWH